MKTMPSFNLIGVKSGSIEEIFSNKITNSQETLLYLKMQLRILSKLNESDSNFLKSKYIERIFKAFQVALHRFSDDFNLFLLYFKFCKQYYITAASSAVNKLLENFSDNPEVWQLAGKWYLENKNPQLALNTITKGLVSHENCHILYFEAIRIGLLSAKTKLLTEEEANKKIAAYVKLFCNCINDFYQFIELLGILQMHEFARSNQKILVETMLEKFEREEMLWHALAQRRLKGLPCHFPVHSLKTDLPQYLAETAFIYKKGLSKIPLENKPSLWSNYLDTLFKALENPLYSSEIKKLLLTELKEASTENCLSDIYYIKWLDVVTNGDASKICASSDEVTDILERATTAYPDSIDLWKLRLNSAVIAEKPRLANKIFDSGVAALKTKSLVLWDMMLMFHSLASSGDMVCSIYERGILESPEISMVLKPRYLEYLAFNKDMQLVRTEYKRLAVLEPHCKELHVVMSNLESSMLKLDLESWQGVHELACEQFGKKDVDCWIDMLAFYVVYNYDESKIKKVYEQAKQSLSALLLPEFQEKIDDLLNNYSIDPSVVGVS